MPRPTPKKETVLLFPNPYFCLGKGGDLGGACPVPEANYGNGRPMRIYVAAERHCENYDARDHLTDGTERTSGLKSRADLYFKWKTKPVEYVVTPETRQAFRAIVENGEAFKCEVDKQTGAPIIPMEQLALARLDLIAHHEARGDHSHRVELDMDWWAEQFPLDPKVAEFKSAKVEERELAIEMAAEDRAKKVAQAKTDAAVEQAKRDAAELEAKKTTAAEVAAATEES